MLLRRAEGRRPTGVGQGARLVALNHRGVVVQTILPKAHLPLGRLRTRCVIEILLLDPQRRCRLYDVSAELLTCRVLGLDSQGRRLLGARTDRSLVLFLLVPAGRSRLKVVISASK